MKNIQSSENDPFADLFSAEEEKSYSDAIKESRQKAKEAPYNEKMVKVIIDYIYNNIRDIISGRKIDHSLADINPECREIIDALTPFEVEEGFTGSENSRKLFDFLSDYNEAKIKAKFKFVTDKIDNESLNLIFQPLFDKGYGTEQAKLGISLDVLSEEIHKDVIKDLVERYDLEQQASILTEKILKIDKEENLYPKVMDEIKRLRESYGSLDKIKREFTDNKKLDQIKNEINSIMDIEMQKLEMGQYEYAALSQADKLENKNKMEKIKSLKPAEIFDAIHFSYIGSILERRNNNIMKIHKDYEQMNAWLDEYAP